MTISIGFMQVTMWNATEDTVDRWTSVRSQQSIPASIFVSGTSRASRIVSEAYVGATFFFLLFMYRDLGLVITASAPRRPGSSCHITLEDCCGSQDFGFRYTADLDVCRCLQFGDSCCPLTWCTEPPKTAIVPVTCIRQPRICQRPGIPGSPLGPHKSP